jgi:hypothetical protein
MVDLEYFLHGPEAVEIGHWLDRNMPNPPLPDPQRWSLGVSDDGRSGIRFEDDRDATLFLLKWAKKKAR